jgi:hypothetical protein
MTYPRTIASLVAISIFFSLEYWLGANWYISLPLGVVGYLLIRYIGWAINERQRFKQEFDQVVGENAQERGKRPNYNEPMAKTLKVFAEARWKLLEIAAPGCRSSVRRSTEPTCPARFPIRANVDLVPTATALSAHDARAERWHFRLGGIG